jgi:hypothetical protein
MRQISNLQTWLIIKLICCFRWIIRGIRIKNSVGVKCLICHRSWIERRWVLLVLPVVGGLVLLLWLLIRSEFILVIEIGLGTNDVLWTAGSKPFGLKLRRQWWFGRRVVDWFHGWNCRRIRIESRSRKDLRWGVSIWKFKTKDASKLITEILSSNRD